MNRKDAVSKLWTALIDVENYLQTGIINQVQKSTSFSGEDATPIKNAYMILKETEPFVPSNIHSQAGESISLAASEFNEFLDVLRIALLEPDEKKKMQSVYSALTKSLDKYRNSLIVLKQTIPKIIEDNFSSTITIKGNNYGQFNVAGRDMHSPAMNITLSELLQKIDKSDLSHKEKETIKGKISEVISHPLVTSVLGGLSGGIIG